MQLYKGYMINDTAHESYSSIIIFPFSRANIFPCAYMHMVMHHIEGYFHGKYKHKIYPHYHFMVTVC